VHVDVEAARLQRSHGQDAGVLVFLDKQDPSVSQDLSPSLK
jgi:hypothetical protein